MQQHKAQSSGGTFNLTYFPVLAAIPTKNGFECLKTSKLASLSVDRGEDLNTR